jgi:hypothetical protein
VVTLQPSACQATSLNYPTVQRMRQLMHDLARHVYNGNRTEEELSNMTRGDILLAAKGKGCVLPPESASCCWIVVSTRNKEQKHYIMNRLLQSALHS